MSKERKTMINTSECENCEYGIMDASNKSRITVYCTQKDKKYFYGQCIPCDVSKWKHNN